jgi:PAS domain S-box-containing protein
MKSRTLILRRQAAMATFRYKRAAVLLLGILTSFLSSTLDAQQSSVTKKVLVLYWYSKDYSWNVGFDQSFQDVLRSARAGTLEYYAEYLESDKFPGEKQYVALHDYLLQKYRDRRMDVVIANSDASLDFLSRYRKDLFTDTPIVFVSARHPERALIAQADVTGIVHVNTYRETLNLVLRLHPDTEQVFVVSGTQDHGKKLEALAREQLQGYEERLKITYFTDYSPGELIAATKALPPRSVVLYVWQQSRNAEGKVVESAEIVSSFAQSTPVPVYGMSNPTIGRGVIGGYINTSAAIGTRAAEMALQIANGVQARDIPVERAPSVPIFDWRELQRWRINEKSLPAGSVIRFKTPSLWEQYRGYVVGALTLIVVLAGLVGWLLLERCRRLRSEEARFKLSTIVESSEDAIIGVSLKGTILSWNLGAQLMYGYMAAETLGRSISIIVPPDRVEENADYLKKLETGERIENFETVRLAKNGQRIDVSVGTSSIRDTRGRIIAAASIGRDITERKRAEQALRESEQNLQRLAVSLINLQDAERRRLARELHDVTAQNVFAISLNLSLLERGPLKESETESLLSDSKQLCDQALQEIRTLSYVLHPPILDHSGLASALRWYVEGFVRRSGINMDTSAIEEVGRLPNEVEIALFRVVQESLTNVSRHSGSSTARIRLDRREHEVLLKITDHGRGMSKLAFAEMESDSLGVGIPGMRQRLRQLGGTLQIESSDRGTVVTVRVPASNIVDEDPEFVSKPSEATV